MSLLEDKITKNRDYLDAAEPSPGHFERFEKKLIAQNDTGASGRIVRMNKFWMRAAIIVILLGISVVLYLVNPGRNTSNLAANTLPADVQEIKMYYHQKTEKELNEVAQCAMNPDQANMIRRIAGQDISKLDSNSVDLENQLIKDSENKKLKDALILNYKTKADLIEDIIKKVCKL